MLEISGHVTVERRARNPIRIGRVIHRGSIGRHFVAGRIFHVANRPTLRVLGGGSTGVVIQVRLDHAIIEFGSIQTIGNIQLLQVIDGQRG